MLFPDYSVHDSMLVLVDLVPHLNQGNSLSFFFVCDPHGFFVIAKFIGQLTLIAQ